MDLPARPIVEYFSMVVEKSKVLLTYFLKLTPVKALQFTLVVGLRIVRTISPSQKNNNGIMPLPPVYTLRYENLFMLNIQFRHTKLVKS